MVRADPETTHPESALGTGKDRLGVATQFQNHITNTEHA